MRRSKRVRRGGDGSSFWISYSDMMAGMLFTFALILFMAVYQLVDLQQKKTIELETKEAQLSTQQSLLIAGTLRDNLLVGCRAPVERAQLEAALRICTCDEWLADLPDGLDTRLQEGGLRLSGGQRQMLVLARALLQEKPMIIMDETFSAIDKQRAVQIMANIRRAHPGKTILLISHEEEIVNRCDGRVYLLPQAG